MQLELIRMGIVYVHLLACCLAIGAVVVSDVQLVRALLRRGKGSMDPSHLERLHLFLTRALLALWLTGASLIAFDVWTKGSETLANPKLQAKVAVVVLLTLNGVAMHRLVLPALRRAGALMRLAFTDRMLAVFTGAVSGVSWFYAALLGVGRPLSWKFSLAAIMAPWPLLVVSGFFVMVTLTAWAQDARSRVPRAAARPARHKPALRLAQQRA